MEPIPDHNARALSRLAEEFKLFTRLKVLIAAKCRQTQALENAVVGLIALLGVDNASGALLRLYGRIVGTTASGISDASLRNRIKARILINKSSGTVPQLLAIFRYLVDEAQTITVTEGKAQVVVEIGAELTTPENAADLSNILRQAKAGGVRALLQTQTAADAGAFTLADALGGSTPGLGLGDTGNAATGGQLGDVR